MNSVNTIEVPPRAGALTQSMRGMGYTLQTAVADIIDNSIAAGAETICLRIDRTKGDVVQRLVISDDGCGMNRAELILAMSLDLPIGCALCQRLGTIWIRTQNCFVFPMPPPDGCFED